MLANGMGRSRSGSPGKTRPDAWNKEGNDAENGPKMARGRSIIDMIRFYDGGKASLITNKCRRVTNHMNL
jgi:hypothetical protein